MYKHNYLNCFGCYMHTLCFALNECCTHFCDPQTQYLGLCYIIFYIWAILYHVYLGYIIEFIYDKFNPNLCIVQNG